MVEQLAERVRWSGAHYNWDEMLNGSIWRWTEGEDYSVSTSSLANYIRRKATQRGMRVRVNIERSDGETPDRIIFQAS